MIESAPSVEGLRALARRFDSNVIELCRFVQVARERCDAMRDRASRGVVNAQADATDAEFVREELDVMDEALRHQNEELERSRLAATNEARRWRELFDGAPEPYVVTDRNGIIVEASRIMRDATEFTAPMPGKPLVNFMHRSDCRKLRDVIRRVVDLGRVDDVAVRIRPRRGGPIFSALVTAVANRGVGGKPAEIRWILRRIASEAAGDGARERARGPRAHDALRAHVAHLESALGRVARCETRAEDALGELTARAKAQLASLDADDALADAPDGGDASIDADSTR